MVGRGAYGRPWFLRQVIDYLRDGSRTPAPGLARRVEVMLEHYEALLTLDGRHNGVRIARKHLGWYARGIDGAADFRARMNGEDDPRSEEPTSELQSLLRNSYAVFGLKKK